MRNREKIKEKVLKEKTEIEKLSETKSLNFFEAKRFYNIGLIFVAVGAAKRLCGS